MARSKSTKANATKKAKRGARARRIVQHAASLAASELGRARGKKSSDPEEDPHVAGDEPSPDDVAPPPPPGLAPSPVPDWVSKLGEVPEDPMAAQHWLFRANVLSAQDALRDDSISAAARRKELRTISMSSSHLMPDARRWESEQLIKKYREELEGPARAKQGATLQELDDDIPPAPDDDDFGGPPIAPKSEPDAPT